MKKRNLKIAQVGLKGIPAKWGGMEKYVEEVGKRLVQRGHEVTVFGSKWYCPGSNDESLFGMRLKSIPTLHFQATDALSNALLSSMHIMLGDYDIVHFHGYASYYFISLIKAAGKKCIITAHGVESGWDNPKYNTFARNIVKTAYMTGLQKADAVTTVARHLSSRIYGMSNIPALVMTSGLDEVSMKEPLIIKKKYGLKPMNYVLYLGRIDPIKRADWLLDLTGKIGNIKIVIAGGSQNSSTDAYYQNMIKKVAGNRQVVFTGPVTGDEKAELLSNCLCLLSPSQYEGLPITLLEASAYSRCCLASDIPAHREIIENGVNGFLFQVDSRKQFIDSTKEIITFKTGKLLETGAKAKQTCTKKYNWDNTTRKFESLYFTV